MNLYLELLHKYPPYEKRKGESNKRIISLKKELTKHPFISGKNICVYIAGSIARNEYGNKSDIDLFIVSKDKISRIEEYGIYAAIIEINSKLGYPEFSNDARYLKVYPLVDLINATGSPRDDNENLFTARQLLLLESKPLYNENLYNEAVNSILKHYFNDFFGKEKFKPTFLLNDILRYWRTLCLNYEQIRHDKTRPWRKKNINLKFSRKITIFATVISIIMDHEACFDFMLNSCQYAPIERLAIALNKTKNIEYKENFHELLKKYEQFIKAKESNTIETNTNLKHQLDESAEWITKFLNNIINDDAVNDEMRMYLIQ